MPDLQELRKKPHLSVSSVNEYVECGLAYRFNKIDKIKSESTSDALIFGSCVHKALEAFHIARKNGETNSLECLIDDFTTHWVESIEKAPDVRFKKGESAQTQLLRGKAILETYYRECPKDDFRVLATEEAFSFEIEGLPIPIIGVMDLIEEDEGTVIIVDFKTSCRAYSRDDIDKSLQLTVYEMAARRNGFADRDILLRFDCMIKTRTPKFAQYYTVRTEEDEQRAIKKIHRVWDGIQKRVFIPNDTSWKCGYCSFKQHCAKWFRDEDAA